MDVVNPRVGVRVIVIQGAYNFNESCAPDIVSGSLPYMDCVFTNCTITDSGLVVKPVSPDKLVPSLNISKSSAAMMLILGMLNDSSTP